MAEVLNVTIAAQVRTYEVTELYMNWPSKYVRIRVQCSNGARPEFEFFENTAEVMMRVVNTADLRNNSLQKRIITFLIANTDLEGTITGVPL